MWSALVLIALTQANLVCWKNSGVTKCVPEGNRVTHGEHTARAGGRSGSQPAPFFAFATASGVGMGSACGCAAVTGTKGESVAFTRAGSAYCTKTGMATTGLTTTSMVLCGTNLPRVEAGSDGVLGVRVEAAGATTLAAATSEDFSNAAWISTATVTADTTTAPSNAVTADTLSDASGAAIQSSCQTVTTASATLHTFSVHLTAGTLAKAGITMTGTGSSTGDCSNTTTTLGATYTRLSCTSPAAYAGTLTAVTVCVQVGTVVGDTGTIIAWGADHEVNAPYLTSYVPSSIGTRALEIATASMASSKVIASLALTRTGPANNVPAAAQRGFASISTGAVAATLLLAYKNGAAQQCFSAGGVGTGGTTGSTGGRSYCALGSTISGQIDGIAVSTVASSAATAGTVVTIGDYDTAHQADSIISQLCASDDINRCR